MKKTSLLEAAAEMLKQSISNAPKEELHKVEGEVQDLGGTTPEKNVDGKIDVNAKEATPPGKQPAGETKAPLDKQEGGAKAIDPHDEGEGADSSQEDLKAKTEAGLAGHIYTAEWKGQLKEDVAKILASETTLPAGFAETLGTIYEARVSDKVATIEESLKKQMDEQFESSVMEIKEELTKQINDFLAYVVEQWMKDNELAVEKGIRAELTEEFIGGLRNLFTEHYIDIPTEKVDVVDELATKVEELTGKLNEEVARGVELQKKLTEAKKEETLKSVCEGLTQTQAEKIRTLAESVEFTADGAYSQKVIAIRENYFPASEPKKLDAKVLVEVTEPVAAEEKKQIAVDPDVSRVAAAITQYLK